MQDKGEGTLSVSKRRIEGRELGEDYESGEKGQEVGASASSINWGGKTAWGRETSRSMGKKKGVQWAGHLNRSKENVSKSKSQRKLWHKQT